MTYVIMITKHQDGFCIWDSKYTDCDVASSGKHWTNPENSFFIKKVKLKDGTVIHVNRMERLQLLLDKN